MWSLHWLLLFVQLPSFQSPVLLLCQAAVIANGQKHVPLMVYIRNLPQPCAFSMWTLCACYRVIPFLKLPCSCSSKWIATQQYRTEEAGVTEGWKKASSILYWQLATGNHWHLYRLSDPGKNLWPHNLFPITGLFVDFHIWMETISDGKFLHQSENKLFEVRILKINNDW